MIWFCLARASASRRSAFARAAVSLPSAKERRTMRAIPKPTRPATRATRPTTKMFTFKGFKRAVAFVNSVAEAANAANHHPDIHLEGYKNVRIVLRTHVAHGITDADVELARTIDAIG